jgi:uncharacterized protein
MNRLFADSSFYVALMSDRDEHHAKAVALSRGFHGHTTTSDFVLMEVGNSLSRTADRPLFLELLKMLVADSQTTVVPATRGLFDASCSLFARRMDKEWSLTDCVSFTIMRQQDLSDALTADHHFEQAGFTAMLR